MQQNNKTTILRAMEMMKICNACRYCESYCAVFEAMESRRKFYKADIYYLANLCHDCRACYYSCQYAPPHQFELNPPKTFSILRNTVYDRFARPFLFLLHNHSALFILSVAILMISVLFLFFGRTVLPAVYSFYKVIPEPVLISVSLAIILAISVFLIKSFRSYWHYIGGKSYKLHLNPAVAAIKDVLTLRYLGSDGSGCNYEDESFSNTRRWAHQLIFYGFMLCFIATITAAIGEHFFDYKPPYSYLSLPVVFGTLGGILQIIGITIIFWIKLKSDQTPYYRQLIQFEISFSLLLFLVNFSGLILLALRETEAMRFLLIVHIGLVWTLFLSLPYSKFVHAIYRFAALTHFHDEEDG